MLLSFLLFFLHLIDLLFSQDRFHRFFTLFHESFCLLSFLLFGECIIFLDRLSFFSESLAVFGHFFRLLFGQGESFFHPLVTFLAIFFHFLLTCFFSLFDLSFLFRGQQRLELFMMLFTDSRFFFPGFLYGDVFLFLQFSKLFVMLLVKRLHFCLLIFGQVQFRHFLAAMCFLLIVGLKAICLALRYLLRLHGDYTYSRDKHCQNKFFHVILF